MTDPYLWLTSAHVVSLIAWMAALLYLPRLMVYHADSPPGSERSEMLKVMERRLLKAIASPAMIATWTFGLLLAWQGGWFASGWLHAKLVLVVAMSGLHGAFSSWVRAFAEDRNARSPRFYRIANEVPTVLLIGIVILAIVKPF